MGCTHAMAGTRRLEENLEKYILSFYHVILGVKLRSSGSTAGVFAHWTVLHALEWTGMCFRLGAALDCDIDSVAFRTTQPHIGLPSSSCPDFPPWVAVTWSCKLNPSSPKLLLDWVFYHSNRMKLYYLTEQRVFSENILKEKRWRVNLQGMWSWQESEQCSR